MEGKQVIEKIKKKEMRQYDDTSWYVSRNFLSTPLRLQEGAETLSANTHITVTAVPQL